MHFIPITLILFAVLASDVAYANLDWLCERIKMEVCNQRRFTRSSGASIPNESNSYRLNPSSVGVDKGFGAELVTTGSSSDYGIVTGNGKVGAAISPTSLEDTFFANLPIEADDDYIARKQTGEAYESNKYTLATATQLLKKSRYLKPSVGVIMKYNKLSKKFSPGAGVNLGIGPLSIGYASNKDDFYYVDDITADITHIRYRTNTLTIGAKMPNFAIDYSIVENELAEVQNSTITIISGTIFWRKFMFTYAQRKEDSWRPDYNVETDTYTYTQIKYETFMGVQYSFKKKFLIGLFSNYFLNNDLSIGLTGFF